ncbi:putative stag domain-containing protein [Rosellinia necatrix]|uniref:Putative stag domain-containing protein n=1 Tax=Rosellinia necatrix TaxID=77044 RepID=A0A1S7ULD7_ROSNE|nr:putative stag domain-containing protein [Rosellinia necatrix]
MEAPNNNASSSPAPRRSGRARVAPQKFSPDPRPSQGDHASSSKRKRSQANDDDDDGENDGSELSDEDVPTDDDRVGDDDDNDDDGDDDANADDEPARRSRKSRSSQKPRSRKPAAKRTKVNGATPAATPGPLAIPAVKLPNRPKKTTKVAPASLARRDENELYSEVFGSGNQSDDVAAHWFQRYQNDNAKALTELINCVLLAAGCDQQLTEDDIRDPENSANRLAELEEAYEQTSISDYPLISRTKSSKNFRELLVGFFDSLITLLHETDIIYNDEELLDNIQRWVGIMSASALRPFRHTATTVGLSMLTALIGVMKQLDDRIMRLNQSLQAESSRRGKNKPLIEDTQRTVDSARENREFIDVKVKDLFDIIFVHRYRDIDPKIRAECIEALGTWVCNLPTVYMSPEYLRYLGWLLSDVNVTTRLEVLKQLAKVLKRDAEKLAHFIDRFRPRLVEMATRDSEVSVRVAAIAVVDVLRRSGMLEPEEVDSVSKLVFDSEIRVRKAVVSFFSELVQEFIDNKIDEIGGNDVLEELFGDQEEEDYDSVRKDWINIKALSENLAVYDAQLDAEQDEIRHGLDVAADVVNAAIPDSRISLAAQVLYEKMPEISNWQVIAGYLLFDHTTSSKSRSSKSNSTEVAVKKAVAPQPQEEAILLEVLATAVKENIAPSMDHDKNKRRHRLDHEAQEDAGLQLAGFIPRLLNKYGSEPAMATTVLRLEHFLDLEVFQQLRQNSATYSQLLEEIATQFSRHVDQALLNEAVTSFLHARQYYELEDLVDGKMAGLWEDSINSLRSLDKICELSLRGNLDQTTLTSLSQTIMKISKLVTVSDCLDVLEAPGTSIDSEQAPIKILVGIVARGRLTESDDDLDDPEDEIVAFAIKSCLFYFMWKVQRLRKAVENDEDIPNDDLDKFVVLRKDLINNLIQTFSSRGFNDDLRLYAVGVACDITQLFIFLRPHINGPQAAKYRKLGSLLEDMPAGLITQEIIPILDAAERAYAKRTKKTLNDPADDDEPLDDELPPEDDEEEELTEQERFAAELKAEKILCELAAKLVMAVLAKTIDHTGSEAGKLRRRLVRNKNKLGTNFKDVVAYLDEDYLRELQGGRKKTAAKNKGKEAAKRPVLSTEVVIDDEDEDDPFEEIEPEEGTAEDLRRRELIDDPIEDEEEEERPANNQAEEDDEVIGD